MPYKYVTLYLICLLLLPCIVVAKDSDILISSTGTGTTLETAKQNALSGLSKSIAVDIKTSTASIDVVKNGASVESVFSNSITTDSNLILRNIIFDKYTQKKNRYYIKASLSQEGLIESINYLKYNVKIIDIYSVNNQYRVQEAHNVNSLVSLLLYAKTKNIKNIDYSNTVNYYHYLSQINFLLKSAGSVSIILQPAQINHNITFDGKVVPMHNNKFFLTSGYHNYAVSSPGYLTFVDSININKDQHQNVYVYLQKKLSKHIKVSLEINNQNTNNNYDSTIKQLLLSQFSKLQLENSKEANKKIIITIKKTDMTDIPYSKEYKHISTTITAQLVSNQNIINTAQETIKYTTSSNSINTIPTDYILKHIDLLLPRLVQGDFLSK